MIISIEGIDGAGKNTLVRALTSRIDAATLTFPRYDTSIHAQLAARALHGQMGDLVDSAHGMATLFALDRYGAREVLDRYADSDEVLLLDRYVASNAAYTAARLKDDAAFDWVYDLEFGQLGLPVPHLQVLLGTSVDEASRRAQKREAYDATRTRDAYEKDGELQDRTFAAYQQLAAKQWASPWLTSSDADDVSEHIIQVISS